MAILGDTKAVSLTLLDGVASNLNPITTNVYTIGTSSLKWNNIYATTFTGNLTGNVTGNATNVTGTIAVDHGGTGATTAANARTNLGLGSMAIETATNYLKWQSTSLASTALYDFGVYRAANTAAGTGPGGSNYYNLINIPYSAASGGSKPYWGWQLGNRTDNDSRLWYRTSGDNVWGDWQTIAHATTSTDNIGSATQPVYMTAAGVITAGTALKALAYKDSLAFSDLTSHPTTLSDYGITNAVQYNGVDNDVGSSSPASTVKAYWANNNKVPKDKIVFTYNSSGQEYTTLFSNRNNQYGTVLRWGYQDKYIRILRAHPNQTTYSGWYTEDWEKISAGYADSAGSCTGNAAGISTTGGTTGKFWRGDNAWSNELTGAYAVNTPILKLISTQAVSSGWSWGIDHRVSNATAGASTCLLTGVANSTKNQAVFGFYYAGSGSDSNYLELGLYSANGLVKVYGNGAVCIGGTNNSYKLYVNGTEYVNGALTTSGNLSVTGTSGLTGNVTIGTTSAGAVGLAQTDGLGLGLSLWGGPQAKGSLGYGIMFALTSKFGTLGSVTSDWATYFTMNRNDARGWIFKSNGGAQNTNNNVTSIAGNGNIYTIGNLTLGEHVKLEYNSTDQSLDFIFI